MEKTPMRKKTVILLELAAIALALGGVAFLVVCGILGDMGYGPLFWPVGGLAGFFGCEVAAIVLLCKILPSALAQDAQKKTLTYDRAELERLEGLSEATVRQTLLRHGFQETAEGYLRKKVFSLAKDAVCYYVRCVPTQDAAASLEGEYARMDRVEERTKSVCVLLFLFHSDPREEDQRAIREAGRNFILAETLLPTQSFHTSIPILVDQRTGLGRYLGAGGISVYAHGCRLLKKLFAPS